METTTRIFNNYRISSNKNLSLEQLSSLYRQTKQESIVAEAFEKVKKLIQAIKNRYPQLETCDIISFALEKLEMCLLTYVPGSSNKFTTYFSTVFKTRLSQEVKSLNYPKRKVIFNSDSLNILLEDGFDIKTNRDIDHNFIVLPSNLTQKEREYCCLVAMNYGNNREIAEYMKVTTMTLTNLRKSLRVKLNYLYK